MNPDAPRSMDEVSRSRHGSLMTSHGNSAASTNVSYSTTAHPHTSTHELLYSTSSSHGNPIPVLSNITGYPDSTQTGAQQHGGYMATANSAAAMQQISQGATPAVSDLVFELASKALKHVQSVGTGRADSDHQQHQGQQNKVPNKAQETRRLHFKIVRFIFHAGMLRINICAPLMNLILVSLWCPYLAKAPYRKS